MGRCRLTSLIFQALKRDPVISDQWSGLWLGSNCWSSPRRRTGWFGASVPVFAAAFLTGINLLIGFIFLRETISEENKKAFDISSINIFRSISRILSRPDLRAVSISFALFNFSFTAFTSLLVLALKDLYGWSAGQTSGIFIVVGVVVTYTQVAVVGKLVNRWSE